MVHPYLRRRAGREKVTYAHPSLEPILQRTLGVPLFQEQLMRMSMAAAGFTGGQAEELRRAMGSKRSVERMKQMEADLRAGMTARGVQPKAQDEIVQSIKSFALYGFPESHSASFALLVYASAYLKAHHPAAFYTALLNNWPMGFYHPATLLTDARRHGVRVLPIDVTRSDWRCTIEGDCVRIGLRYVAGLREATAARLVDARPFASVDDLWRRVQPSATELRTLASIGALNPLGEGGGDGNHGRALTRRSALWRAAALGRHGNDLFRGADAEAQPEVPLAEMTLAERLAADYRSTGMTVGPHPLALHRRALDERGVTRAVELSRFTHGVRARAAGSVIVRQRPGSAKGFFFMTLEDETGFANAIVTPPLFLAHRTLLTSAPALIVEGKLQNQDGVVSIKADRFFALALRDAPPARNFH
jgi:error-prone DNA polymerase